MFFNPRANYSSGPFNGLGNIPGLPSTNVPSDLPHLNQRFWRPSVPIAVPTQAWSLVPPPAAAAQPSWSLAPQVTHQCGQVIAPHDKAWHEAPLSVESCQHLPAIQEKKVELVKAAEEGESGSVFEDPRLVETERLLIEEMRVYNNSPRLSWYIIVVGILHLCLAVPTTLFCISVEQIYYARYWTGIILIIFGISGYIHRGDYLKYWKSALYIIVGMVTLLCVLVCSCLTTIRFLHQLAEVAQFSDWPAYLVEMSIRMKLNKDYPLKDLGNPPDTNMKVCFAMSGVSMFVTLAAYLVATVTVLVIDKFYSSHFVITRRVLPFCTPKLFNPYGQVSLGEAQIFIGFVLQSLVFGNYSFAWQDTYIPVIAGIVPMIGGVFAAISLKSCGVNNKLWNVVAIVLEVLSVLLSVVAIIIISIGMSENIKTLSNTTVMTYTSFSRMLMIVSIFNFCICDVVCIVNIFYSGALLIRILVCLCRPTRGSLRVVAEKTYMSKVNDRFEADSGYRLYDRQVMERLPN